MTRNFRQARENLVSQLKEQTALNLQLISLRRREKITDPREKSPRPSSIFDAYNVQVSIWKHSRMDIPLSPRVNWQPPSPAASAARSFADAASWRDAERLIEHAERRIDATEAALDRLAIVAASASARTDGAPTFLLLEAAQTRPNVCPTWYSTPHLLPNLKTHHHAIPALPTAPRIRVRRPCPKRAPPRPAAGSTQAPRRRRRVAHASPTRRVGGAGHA